MIDSPRPDLPKTISTRPSHRGDTSPEVQARFEALLLARSPEERLRMAARMFDTARELLLAGIRQRFSHLTPAQERGLLFLYTYRDDFSPATLQSIMSRLPDLEIPPELALFSSENSNCSATRPSRYRPVD